jgi:hypothetical protein
MHFDFGKINLLAPKNLIYYLYKRGNMKIDFDVAIRAHSFWKKKLSAYLQNPDGTLDPSDLKCPLGMWISSAEKQLQQLPEFVTLKHEHTKFHKCATQIIDMADTGEDINEEIALGVKSAFALASNDVVIAIMAIRTKVK